MPFYTRYLRDVRRKCVVSANSDRYAKCIHASGSVTCDVWGLLKGDWEKLKGAERKLSAKGDAVFKKQQRQLSLLATVLAKL